MRVYYREEQNVTDNKGTMSPSAGKPAQVMQSWIKLDPRLDIHSFHPATREQLYQVHDKKYVNGVLDGKQRNGFGNKLPSVAKALPFVAGSMVAAALHALKTGETSFSPTSGAHHACYEHGGGFCTFNFLVLAALEAHEAGASTVGIADLDAHWGNGVVDIVDKLNLGFIRYYSYGSDQTRDTSKNNTEWLSVFAMQMQDLVHGCDLLIFNAGMDASENDPLCGGRGLSDTDIVNRDNIVFRAAARAGVPVAVSLAGGYQSPVSKVVDFHNITYEAGARWENS